jgi:hypothetical protein
MQGCLLGFAHNAQPEEHGKVRHDYWLRKAKKKKCVGYFDQAVCL